MEGPKSSVGGAGAEHEDSNNPDDRLTGTGALSSDAGVEDPREALALSGDPFLVSRGCGLS